MRGVYACVALGLLALGACGRDPRLAVDQALAAGDLARAQALLDEVVPAHPQRPDLHALRYVLYRHLALNGPAEGRDKALIRSIEEYEWLAGHFKIARDYANSDASLRAHEGARALLEQAGRALYR